MLTLQLPTACIRTHLPKIIKKIYTWRFTGTRYIPANTGKICTHKLKGIGVLTTHLPIPGTQNIPLTYYRYILHVPYAIPNHNNDYSVTLSISTTYN